MENVSQKSYHHHGSNGGFIKTTASSKSLYDDVFGGPPKFGVPTLAPRFEDYSEIFGGFHSSRASCIPVLDLPVVDVQDDHFSFDVQSSHFDYSEIFGGFQVFDFGLCYEDLVGLSTSASGYDSSDEAWSPAQSETLSDESDPSAVSERSRSSSGADVHHSSDDTKQFNISYHKSFQRTGGGGSNGTTHVTQLHAIPGYTCTVSGSQASRSTEDEESPRQTATLDHNHNVDLSGTVLEDKRFKRTSHMSNSFIMHETDSKLPQKCSEASCTPQKPFVTVSDISLRTRPSGLPPPSRPPPAKKGDFDRLNSRLKASKSSAFERKQGDSSQPYFDVEEYASSSAAASTAAIKDAMEKAQAKLRSAKELMERKKQDLKSYTKLHLENGILEEKPSKAFDQEDKAQSMCVENMEEVFNNSEVISGNIEDEKHFQFNRKSEESEQGKPNMSSQQPYKAEGKVAWREGAEFFEVVETYPSCRSPEKVKNESGLLHNIEPHEYKQFEAASDRLDHLETCKNVVAKKAPECNDESEEKVGKVSYQWGNMYQSSKGEDLCSQLEHKETVTVEENLFDFNTTERNVKAEKRFFDTDAEHFDIKLMAESEVEYCEGGLKDVVFEARNGQRVNEIPKQEGEKQSDVVSEREEGAIHQEENAKRSKKYFKSEKDDENSEVDFTMDPKDQDAKGAFELEQEEIHFKAAHKKKEHGREEAEGRPNGACEGEDSDVVMMEVLEQQEDKTKSPVASEVEFENISEEASVLEETEQTISCDDKLEDLCEQTDRLETELQSCERKSEVGMTNLLPEDCCTNVCKRKDVTEHGKDQIKRADTIGSTSLNGHSTNSSGADMCIGKSSDRLKKTASETANHSGHIDGKYTECLTVNTNGVQSGTNQKTTGEMFTAGRSDHRNGTDPVGPRVNAKVGQSGTYQEVMEERASNAKKIGDALAAVLEDVEILSSTDQKAATASAQKNQRNPNKVVTPDAQKMDERLEKDKKLQEEYLRKLEEEREREREREKDRMSVTREALERSYLETHERVERATAEIRQRAMAEARERSSAEQEARLRAERAAVERATAEARQRAFEKAMAEKAIQESRERMERSSSEKFSAYSRGSEMRQSSSSEQHELQSTETSKLRYSYSSAHAGIEGESPQRCKARLERYRRTSERAAKALAEKNMRDLLAQREQAERNRLAENLDAEVKRWSSGKEGNLRALLSTLQYILGPNSGWQPIPLTEVITSAAVKKAYRKATLCVHPDKLQQRGATIQQKYICEKVFDLLKEAWNRFNSEER